MRRSGWNGNPPKNDAEARLLLLNAADTLIKRVGLAKVTVTAIADEAGVTRATLYRYFRDGVDIVRLAAVNATGAIIDRTIRHSVRFETPEERVVEAMVYAYKELPNDPTLWEVFSLGNGFDRVSEIFEPTAMEFAAGCLQAIRSGDPQAKDQDIDESTLELTELLVRLIWSFLVSGGTAAADEDSLRTYLSKWVPKLLA